VRGKNIKQGKGQCFSDGRKNREGEKGAGNSHGVMGGVRVSKVTGRGEPGKSSTGGPEKVMESVTYRGNRDKEVGKSNRGGVEDTSEFSACVVLSSLKEGEEGGLADVCEPDLRSVGENGHADGVEDFAPGDKLQAPDGVTKDAERSDEAADAIRHGTDMEGPVELGSEEDPKIADGLGNWDGVGCGGTRRQEDRGRGGAQMAGKKLSGVEKHELSFVKVDGKACAQKPGVNSIPSGRNFGNSREEGGSGGINASIVDV